VDYLWITVHILWITVYKPIKQGFSGIYAVAFLKGKCEFVTLSVYCTISLFIRKGVKAAKLGSFLAIGGILW